MEAGLRDKILSVLEKKRKNESWEDFNQKIFDRTESLLKDNLVRGPTHEEHFASVLEKSGLSGFYFGISGFRKEIKGDKPHII